MIRVAGDVETRERNTRRPRGDAVRLLPMVRPVRQVSICQVEERITDLRLVQCTIGDQLRQLTNAFVVVLERRIGGRGAVVRRTGPERFPKTSPRALAHQPERVRELIVPPNVAQLDGPVTV